MVAVVVIRAGHLEIQEEDKETQTCYETVERTVERNILFAVLKNQESVKPRDYNLTIFLKKISFLSLHNKAFNERMHHIYTESNEEIIFNDFIVQNILRKKLTYR